MTNEIMNCYCGGKNSVYGKLPRRSVENSVLCEKRGLTEWERMIDSLRIHRAQANRMFHKCESWCLFDLAEPESKSWLWNKKGECWKQQGPNSLCNRIVGRNSAEFQHVKQRSSKMCKKDLTGGIAWKLEPKGSRGRDRSCDVICGNNGLVCELSGFLSVTWDASQNNPHALEAIWGSVGVDDCRFEAGADLPYQPVLSTRGGENRCILSNRQGAVRDNACRARSKSTFRRLCPCLEKSS